MAAAALQDGTTRGVAAVGAVDKSAGKIVHIGRFAADNGQLPS